jgi:phospholipid/cholesterol/gamma-HCH transport system ATP-binding protein
LIHTLNDALGLTSIIVSHDIAETCAIADDVYLLSGGKVVEHGTAEALGKSDSAWAQQFLKGEADGPVAFHYPAADYVEDLLSQEQADAR